MFRNALNVFTHFDVKQFLAFSLRIVSVILEVEYVKRTFSQPNGICLLSLCVLDIFTAAATKNINIESALRSFCQFSLRSENKFAGEKNTEKKV